MRPAWSKKRRKPLHARGAGVYVFEARHTVKTAKFLKKKHGRKKKSEQNTCAAVG
jgi:hypothetical protein